MPRTIRDGTDTHDHTIRADLRNGQSRRSLDAHSTHSSVAYASTSVIPLWRGMNPEERVQIAPKAGDFSAPRPDLPTADEALQHRPVLMACNPAESGYR
jgi:hypothetical protein